MMRVSVIFAVASSVALLGGCDESAREQRADTVEEAGEGQAEQIRETADERAENVEDAAENQAEAIREGEANTTTTTTTTTTNSTY